MTLESPILPRERGPEVAGCGPLIPAVTGGGSGRSMRKQVFDCVRAAGQIPRVDVAKELGVSPGSVTAITSELIEAGFIREVPGKRREGDTARGRPPVALGVQPRAGLVAGIKLSDNSHSAVIVDFAGTKIAAASLPSGALRQGTDTMVTAAEAVLDAGLDAAGLTRSDLMAVGVGVPGVIDHESGIALWSPLLIDRAVPLGARLAERLGLPVKIDNDANLVTLAELWFGAGRSLPDFAVVTIEYGVGMGMVINHQLYRGAQGLGMELGHTKVQLDGALCRCGQRGCLEAYVADYALVREASTALNWGNREINSPTILLESLYTQAKAGNLAARAIFDRAGRYLAVGLANVVNLFDPALILLSGERMRYDYLYAEEVFAEANRLRLETGRPPPRIEPHAWGDMIWAQGAAALALDAATETALSREAAT